MTLIGWLKVYIPYIPGLGVLFVKFSERKRALGLRFDSGAIDHLLECGGRQLEDPFHDGAPAGYKKNLPGEFQATYIGLRIREPGCEQTVRPTPCGSKRS